VQLLANFRSFFQTLRQITYEMRDKICIKFSIVVIIARPPTSPAFEPEDLSIHLFSFLSSALLVRLLLSSIGHALWSLSLFICY